MKSYDEQHNVQKWKTLTSFTAEVFAPSVCSGAETNTPKMVIVFCIDQLADNDKTENYPFRIIFQIIW